MHTSNAAGMLAVLLAAAVALSGCSGPPATVTAEPDGQAVAVRAIRVQPEPLRREVEVVGTLAGDREVTLSAEVPGRVVRIHADLGDRVAENQILVELDPAEYQLAVERQEAALAEVLAQLGVAQENDPLPEASETSLARRATAEATDARANYERMKMLQAEGVVSQQAYDSAEARYQVTQAAYAAALEQARNLAARAENLRAQLSIARKSLADTRIRAPFAGTVRERMVEVGQYVREQTATLSLATANPLKLRASIPERWFPYAQPGARVELTVEAYPGELFSGSVTRVARAGVAETRSFSFEARVENPGERLRPGLFARGRLATSKVDSVIRVPSEAVVSFYGVQKVYAVIEGVIREKVVKLGDQFGAMIEVTEGLAAGDWIATTNLARLREGVSVQVETAEGGNR
ncbi:MAG: efflux RND transporter periplasmic adaptor subunit [Terriglobia bacterium]